MLHWHGSMLVVSDGRPNRHKDIETNRIDYAVVAGASAVLQPQTSYMQMKMNMLSPEVSVKASYCVLRVGLPELSAQPWPMAWYVQLKHLGS